MREFRSIKVAGETYHWRFSHYPKKDKAYSDLLVTANIGMTAELVIRFYLNNQKLSQSMLKTGFYVKKNDKRKMISLIDPQLIAEIISYVTRKKIIDFNKKRGLLLESGELLLKEMGYMI